MSEKQKILVTGLDMFGYLRRPNHSSGSGRDACLTYGSQHRSRAVGRINPKGQAVYASTLPLENIYGQLCSAHVLSSFSHDAGVFVYNELMLALQ